MGGYCLKMNVAIYARVSTDDQFLENQINPMVERCNKEGWQYEIFKEKISGAKEKRTHLDRMMQAARAGEFNCVMVWKLDRLGRSTIHVIQLIEEFNKLGVQFIAITQNIDTQGAQGRFFLTVMAAFAELERELIRERTIAGLENARRKGKTLGRPAGSKDKKPRRRSGYHQRWAGGKRNNPKGKVNSR